MKQSYYNVSVDVQSDKTILYNTLTRRYSVYRDLEYRRIITLLNDLNKGKYEIEEINIIKDLIAKGIIVKDDVNELEVIEYKENSAKFSDSFFRLQILPTMDCNFRCVYCYEEHKKNRIDDEVEKKIIKLVQKIAMKVKRLHISWFGGEPLLEIDRIMHLTGEIKNICHTNNCTYSATMTTNGYLLDDKTIDILKELDIQQLQITLDGPEDYHNKKRPLANGAGTYRKIMENINKLLEDNIKVTLRINIDDDNYTEVEKLLEIIPREKRDLVTIGIFNVYQNKVNISVFPLFKSAFEKGYHYNFTNKQFACELCLKNGLVITPDGKIIPCTINAEKGYSFGYISDSGDIVINDKAGLYYKIKNQSSLKNEKCIKCKQLPMCIGTCKFGMALSKECDMDTEGQMNITENILLHYYYDLAQSNKKGDELYEYQSFEK
jgi:uncharacterized protein